MKARKLVSIPKTKSIIFSLSNYILLSVPDQMKAFQILHNQSKHAAWKRSFAMMSVTEDLSSVTFFSTCHFQLGHYKSNESFLSHMI